MYLLIKIKEVDMEQNIRNYEETDIDLSRYVQVIAKRKKTLIAVFLLTLAIGVVYILFSPKIYRVSMMIQPPVTGPSLTGANDLEPAENLKGLIVNGAYNEELKRILNVDLDKNGLDLKVVIPSKTNILQISVDLEEKKKALGISLLRNLSNLISDSYARNIDAKASDIANQIKLNERAILNAREKAESLRAQISEIEEREDKLRDEIKSININTAQILEKREKTLRENSATESAATLLLANYIQNNSSYLNQVNNQSSDLSIRKVNLNLELKSIGNQINNFQTEIDRLNISKSFIANLKIIAQPRVLPDPVSPNKKRILAVSIVMGLFLGALAIFLQEFWANNLLKK
jgi:uncharacterized protein involved in exopolysaccharide biosynthesis